jgi:hypothetical protein
MVPLLLPCNAHRVVLHRCVVREWCHPSGSTGATCLHAAARPRRAARAVQGDVWSVWQVLPGTPSAPPIPAQRVARCDDHYTRNCLLKNKLRQRYSKPRHGLYFVTDMAYTQAQDFTGRKSRIKTSPLRDMAGCLPALLLGGRAGLVCGPRRPVTIYRGGVTRRLFPAPGARRPQGRASAAPG